MSSTIAGCASKETNSGSFPAACSALTAPIDWLSLVENTASRSGCAEIMSSIALRPFSGSHCASAVGGDLEWAAPRPALKPSSRALVTGWPATQRITPTLPPSGSFSVSQAPPASPPARLSVPM